MDGFFWFLKIALVVGILIFLASFHLLLQLWAWRHKGWSTKAWEGLYWGSIGLPVAGGLILHLDIESLQPFSSIAVIAGPCLLVCAYIQYFSALKAAQNAEIRAAMARRRNNADDVWPPPPSDNAV